VEGSRAWWTLRHLRLAPRQARAWEQVLWLDVNAPGQEKVNAEANSPGVDRARLETHTGLSRSRAVFLCSRAVTAAGFGFVSRTLAHACCACHMRVFLYVMAALVCLQVQVQVQVVRPPTPLSLPPIPRVVAPRLCLLPPQASPSGLRSPGAWGQPSETRWWWWVW
jgi:hypothetical protein